MPLVRVGFDVEGQRQINRALELTEAQAADLSEPLGEMADVIIQAVREQFATEGAAGRGHRWKPLSDPYARWKQRHWPGRPILVRTGGMKGAMLNRQTAVTITPHRMIYEPKSKIAGYHQRGATWVVLSQDGPDLATLPAREMIALTMEQKRQAVDRVFTRWVATLTRRTRAGARARPGL